MMNRLLQGINNFQIVQIHWVIAHCWDKGLQAFTRRVEKTQDRVEMDVNIHYTASQRARNFTMYLNHPEILNHRECQMIQLKCPTTVSQELSHTIGNVQILSNVDIWSNIRVDEHIVWQGVIRSGIPHKEPWI